jgi:F0F1-type ATP synthase membrane subunit a
VSASLQRAFEGQLLSAKFSDERRSAFQGGMHVSESRYPEQFAITDCFVTFRAETIRMLVPVALFVFVCFSRTVSTTGMHPGYARTVAEYLFAVVAASLRKNVLASKSQSLFGPKMDDSPF